MKPIIFIVVFLLLVGCGGNDFSRNACEGQGGVALCYRPTGATHGHIMCKDGTQDIKECY